MTAQFNQTSCFSPGKFNVLVAFNAVLTDTVTLTGQGPVICGQIVDNEGGGYDDETGIFTAPVSGSYCFMVTSSPFSDNVDESCALAIMLEDDIIGFLEAHGNEFSTGHAAGKVEAGQQVWLRSCANNDFETNRYSVNGTTFTGMLLQPEL